MICRIENGSGYVIIVNLIDFDSADILHIDGKLIVTINFLPYSARKRIVIPVDNLEIAKNIIDTIERNVRIKNG